MFTGLIRELGEVESVEQRDGGVRIEVRTALALELKPGDSIAVDGVCLTALEPADQKFAADLSDETLERSTLGQLQPGDQVNLEPATRAGEPLGGHIVQGHVDGVGAVESVADVGSGRDLRFSAEPSLLRYLVEKGSVAVNGVSLTVTDVDETGFSVSLIPETLGRTKFTKANSGDRVNLEVDVIAKYVEKLVNHD